MYTESKLEVVGPVTNRSPLRAERQVIGGYAGLERGENKNLAVVADLENRSAAIADIKISGAVERDPSRHAHALGVGGHGAVRRDPVHRSVKARGDVHLAGAIEGDRRGVRHLRQERLDVVVGVDLENGHRNFLAPRSRRM